MASAPPEPSAPAGGRERSSRRAIAAALEAIEALGAGRSLRLAVSAALRGSQDLGPKERRHVAVAARGVARWLRSCDVALSLARAPECIPADRALLRYLALRIAVEGEPEAEVLRALALPGPRRPRALTDRALGEVARSLPRPGPAGPASVLPDGRATRPPRDPAVALGLRYSVPDLLAERLLRALGAEEAALCLDALDREPRIALRVNGARATREEVMARLQAAGVAVEPGEDPLAIRVEDRAGLFDAPPFRQGLVLVQDEGSQAVVAACAAQAGEAWLDLCAGSGGKALALASEGARVTAWDASRRRLAMLPGRARRARLSVDVAPELPAGLYDGVLVDAPCSGSGALQREPDARWRLGLEALARLTRVQDELLDLASARVRPGGALVYATCSLLREEGEDRVAALLASECLDLELEERRWPHRHPGAGFYLARLRRPVGPCEARGEGPAVGHRATEPGPSARRGRALGRRTRGAFPPRVPFRPRGQRRASSDRAMVLTREASAR